MTAWEYKVVKYEPGGWGGGKTAPAEIARDLNLLGESGWEVTGIIETNRGEGRTRDVLILLKRPKI